MAAGSRSAASALPKIVTDALKPSNKRINCRVAILPWSDFCCPARRMWHLPHCMGISKRWRVGVDSGGTFTDVCLFDEESGRVETWKVSSTPDDPSRGIAEGVEEAMRRVA